MEPRSRAVVEGLIVFVLGVLPGFFVVFNVVFSDAFRFADHAIGVAYPFLAYLVLGGLIGILTRSDPRLQAALLVAPGVLLLVWYSLREPNLGYHVLVLAATLLGAFVGVLGGRRFQRPHGPTTPA